MASGPRADTRKDHPMTISEPTGGPAMAAPATPDVDAATGAVPADRPLPGPAQVRQGDVLLDPVATVPVGARPVARAGGRVVLAEGEATGHAHAIRSPGATLLRAGEERYLRVASPVTLGHEEHGAIEVAPGTYRVVIQREYVPPEVASVAFRRVID